jgi:hypothetical protein
VMRMRALIPLLFTALIVGACATPTAAGAPPAGLPNGASSASPTGPAPSADAASAAAARVLAGQLGIPVDQVNVVSVEPQQWPDGCLGLPEPGEMCAMHVVPGYRIVLEAEGQRYTFRTDLSGDVVRQEKPAATPATQGLVISWHRSGGFAGFCDDLAVYLTGFAYPTSCKGGTAAVPARVRLTPAQLGQLYAWVDQFQLFSLDQNDPATADAMQIHLEFSGNGSQIAGPADQNAILSFAASLMPQK